MLSSIHSGAIITKRDVLVLAWPAIIEMSLHMLAFVVDVAMVGRLGAEALSAVGLGGQIYFSLSFFLGSVGIGVTALVARYRGAEQFSDAARTSEQGLFLSFGLGLLTTLILFFGAYHLYRLVGLAPNVVAMGTQYTRIVAPAALLFIPTIIINGILRGGGDTRTPLIITAVTNSINIAGDYVLIFGHFGFPTLGTAGAAIALTVGQGVGGILAIMVLFRSRHHLFMTWRNVVRPNVLRIRQILTLSLPAGMETLLMDASRTVTTLIVASMGAVTLASHQVAITAESLSFMPGYGFAIATSILTGQSLGMKDTGRAEQGAYNGWGLSVMIMGSMGVLFLAFPHALVRLFTTDPSVIDLAAACLRIAGLIQIPMATTEIFIGVHRGAGDTKTAMRVTALGAWGIRVPLIILAVYVFEASLLVIWTIALIEWTVRSLAMFRSFRSGKWKTIAISPREP